MWREEARKVFRGHVAQALLSCLQWCQVSESIASIGFRMISSHSGWIPMPTDTGMIWWNEGVMGGEREGEKSKCHFNSFSLLFSSLTSRGFHSHISHGPKEGMRSSPSSGKNFELQIYSLVQNRFPTLVLAWHPDQPTNCQYGKVATWIHSTKLPFFCFSL